MHRFVCTLDVRWASYLGCRPENLHDGGRHIVAQPEWPPAECRSVERLPWPLTRGPLCLFTKGAGWVLSAPRDMGERARRLCGGRSFQELVAQGDQSSRNWFDGRESAGAPERPGAEAYPEMRALVSPVTVRGWSHYVFSYADPATWRGAPDDHVTHIEQSDPDVWSQWQAWPGPCCNPKVAETFGVADAYGYLIDGQLVSVSQIQAHHAEHAWEYSVDTLPASRGRGYATAVCRAATMQIVGQGHVPYHYADVYNMASLRLPAKLGYVRYGEALVAHVR